MNQTLLSDVINRALARAITFPDLLGTLSTEGIESYHVDFLRDEVTFYASNGESFVAAVPFAHEAVARDFSAEALHAINQRVQGGQAGFADFVRESTHGAGCAYYIVSLNGRKVRYFGRDGGEHVELFPGSN